MAMLHDISGKQEMLRAVQDVVFSKINPENYEKENANPNEEGVHEDGFQVDFSRKISAFYVTLREVNAYANKQKQVQIDESLCIKSTNNSNYFILGELKFHGKTMTEREFVQEVKNDFNELCSMLLSYSHVAMIFCAFVSCEESEINEVSSWIEKQTVQYCTKIDKEIKEVGTKDKYYAIVIGVLPDYADKYNSIFNHKPSYGNCWDSRLNSLTNYIDKKRYYFSKFKV